MADWANFMNPQGSRVESLYSYYLQSLQILSPRKSGVFGGNN